MIGLSQHNQFYLYSQPTDMRKGFDGLSGLIIDKMQGNPLDGKVYLFVNRRRDKMKMLVWEPGGFMMYYKRLEQGTFEHPQRDKTNEKIEINWEVLVLMISGIKLDKIIRKKRYKLAQKLTY